MPLYQEEAELDESNLENILSNMNARLNSGENENELNHRFF